MKQPLPPIIVLIVFFFSCFSFLGGAEKERRHIKEYALDEHVVYTIPVPYKEGVTTFLFPGSLQNISGGNVTQNPEQPADFLLSYVPGQFYFHLRSLRKHAQGVLNVVYHNRVYILRLKGSEKPLHSVSFFQPQQGQPQERRLTPTRLLGLIDKAKDYSLLCEHHPEAVAEVDFLRPNKTIQYLGFSVLVDEVFRFEKEDTLIFKILLNNLTDDPIYFQKERLAVRVANRIYYQSFVDASGVMPAKAIVAAYFSITGTPRGGRNNLSVNNAWNILVPRSDPLVPVRKAIAVDAGEEGEGAASDSQLTP